jgi:flagellar biosynthetic protein FliS
MTNTNQSDATVEYRRAAVRSAGQVELVIMLYDLLLQKLRWMQQTMNNVESRSAAAKDALEVLQVLQGTLNLEAGEPARNMNRLYTLLRSRLLEAHAQTSPEILEAQIALLLPLRAAWMQVKQSQDTFLDLAARQVTDGSQPASKPEPTTHWRA